MTSQTVIDLTLPEETRAESQPPRKRKKTTCKDAKQSKSNSRETSSEHFYVDIVPMSLPPSAQFVPSQKPASEEVQMLLLPSHVSVFGNDTSIVNVDARVARPADLEADDEAEFIEYLDFDDHKVLSFFQIIAYHLTSHSRTLPAILKNSPMKKLSRSSAKLAVQKGTTEQTSVLSKLFAPDSVSQPCSNIASVSNVRCSQ